MHTQAVESEIDEFKDILLKLDQASSLAFAAAESEIEDAKGSASAKDDGTIKRLDKIHSLMTELGDVSEEVETFMRGAAKLKEDLSKVQDMEYSCQKIDEMLEDSQGKVGTVKCSSAQEEMLKKLGNEIENLKAPGGDSDADFVVMQSIESYKDPVTKKLIKDPVRSQAGSH